MIPDYEMTNRFLAPFDGPITFQFFDDKDKKNRKAATHRTLKSSPAYAFLYKKQREGCGVYFMVNLGDGKGRKAKNVVKVRAVFIDLDGSPLEPAVRMLKPHIIVESSPGRFHLYWLVSDCPLQQFKPLQQAIAKKFDGDKKCVDLCRVLRVPGFYHLKGEPVMTKLLEVNDFPKYTTQQVIDCLGLAQDAPVITSTTLQPKQQAATSEVTNNTVYEYTMPDTGEVIDLAVWAAKNPLFNIVSAISPQHLIGKLVDGKQHIRCPFEHEHTDPSPDLATFVCNAPFTIHCMHDHCAERDRLAFLVVMLEQGWISADLLQAAPLPMKRPSKFYFPVKEIAESFEWSTLNADEYRIALHLTALAWASDDGTLPDDNWIIARRLSICEAEWLAYRGILQRAGWLLVSDGRLSNSTVKREFDNAQTALMKKIISGQFGGKQSRK